MSRESAEEGLSSATNALREWAKRRQFVRRVFIYGSRVQGTHTKDSDIDVAIEFDPVGNDMDCLTTWVCDAKKWRAELGPLLPWELHLEWHDPEGETPRITAGLDESSILVYEREDLVIKPPNQIGAADG